MDLLYVLAGIALLYVGGEVLVKGAVTISRLYGISSFVVGLTVVAFGTSTPELASTLIAVWRGSPDLALGNIIGSNSANIGLILGATAMIEPIRAHRDFLRRETPLLLVISTILCVVVYDGELSRPEGLTMTVLLLAYMIFLFFFTEPLEVHESDEDGADETSAIAIGTLGALLMVGAGALTLVAGASAMIEGAVNLARQTGVSERVIGITLVAFGTSLPELATAVVAALRKESDIALGNVVGSNIFNILGVLGVTAATHPFTIPTPAPWSDIIIMLAFSVLLIPFVATSQEINRAEGALILAAYLAYVAILFVV